MVSILVAPHGERIVGFYSGPGTWLSHEVSILSTYLILLGLLYAKGYLYSTRRMTWKTL